MFCLLQITSSLTSILGIVSRDFSVRFRLIKKQAMIIMAATNNTPPITPPTIGNVESAEIKY